MVVVVIGAALIAKECATDASTAAVRHGIRGSESLTRYLEGLETLNSKLQEP